jgi:hypothetical protein
VSSISVDVFCATRATYSREAPSARPMRRSIDASSRSRRRQRFAVVE